jgi:predicted transposase YbfD/YdcC
MSQNKKQSTKIGNEYIQTIKDSGSILENKTVDISSVGDARNVMRFFMDLPDTRVERTKAHPLINIIMIAICAVLGGSEGWVEVEEFGKDRLSWFKKFLTMPNGIPSHDTFGRVFSLLNPVKFQSSFGLWMQSALTLDVGDVVAIDGKTSRHTFADGVKPLHTVSAYASGQGLTLGQVAVDQKSNEITAIPKLLDIIDIKGCLVTTDAFGCQGEVVASIVDRKADYLLAVKGNQGLLHRSVIAAFEGAPTDAVLSSLITTNTSENTGHGRVEKRVCDVLSGPEVISRLDHKNNWVKLNTIVRVTATRTSKRTGEITSFTRYYICSLEDPSAERIQAAVRAHWGIENGLHWVLDMAMRDDESRIRTDHAPANMVVLRHIALNIIRSEAGRKLGIKISQRKAGRSTEYMEKLLGLVGI